MRFRQAVLEYSNKYGVTRAAIRYKVNRQYIQSLADRSHRPHSHPNQHTPEEIKLILDMRRRNPHTGLVVFWVKLRQRGYTRSISGLYRFLRKRGQMAVKLPNPKRKSKPYEQMQYPGQRVQIDVKFVPQSCIAGQEKGTQYYQYTFIDEYSRFRYLEAFEEHNTYSSTVTEFTNRLLPRGSDRLTLFEQTLQKLGIRHKLIRPYTPRHNGKVERSHRKDNEEFYALHSFYSFDDFKKQLAVRERAYNNFPMRPLNWRSPKQVLDSFSSV